MIHSTPIFYFLIFQYITSGVLAIFISTFLLYKSKKNLTYCSFFAFGVVVGIWEFLAFLHRTATSFEAADSLFLPIKLIFPFILPFYLLAAINIWKERKTSLLILIFGIVYAFILTQIKYNFILGEYGWAYTFLTDGPTTVLLGFLTIGFIFIIMLTLCYLYLKSPRGSTLRKKFGILLGSFAIFQAAGITISNYLIILNPGAPPLGGILYLLTFMSIAWVLRVKKQEVTTWTADEMKVETSSLLTSLLQNFYQNIPSDSLGQGEFKFMELLRKMGLVKFFKNGRIDIPKSKWTPAQLFTIADTALEYMKKEKLGPTVVEHYLTFLNAIYPNIETDIVALVKNHEDYIKENRLLPRIAEGKLRSLYLPNSFTEEDFEKFSTKLGLTHMELIGNPVLAEFSPSESYEGSVVDFITETLANGEQLALFTRRGSSILRALHDRGAIHIFYLSPEASRVDSISTRETDLPLYDISFLLDALRQAVKKERCSVIIDNLTDLCNSLGFEKAYRFTRHAVEFVTSSHVSALLLLSAEGHGKEAKIAFETLFHIILTVKGTGWKAVKK